MERNVKDSTETLFIVAQLVFLLPLNKGCPIHVRDPYNQQYYFLNEIWLAMNETQDANNKDTQQSRCRNSS